jgi:hypothetical protein
MTFEERIRACLGPVPVLGARQVLPTLKAGGDVRLAYSWIADWSVLDGIDFLDGQQYITFLRPTGSEDSG